MKQLSASRNFTPPQCQFVPSVKKSTTIHQNSSYNLLDLFFEKRHLKTKANDMKIKINERNAFAQTCPVLFTTAQCKEPYGVIEQFFSFCALSGYREELTEWFKHALSEGVKYKRASDLLFMHNQFLQLIQAGFIIASKGLSYTSVPKHNDELFCDWLLRCSHTKDCMEYMPYWLEVHHRQAPLAYLQKTLTIKTVTYLRKGLQEWLEAALSKHLCIAGLERKYLLELYVLLQKIVEACYLVLITEVSLNKEEI